MVFLGSIVLFLIIWCIITSFAKKITNPITILTGFTNEMKKMRSIEEKQDFVKTIISHDLFQQVAEVWKKHHKSSPLAFARSRGDDLSTQMLDTEE
jgi:hypothetical protein